MRTIGVKSSHMLRNVIGNKMNRKIRTIGNKIMPDAIQSFSQIMPRIMEMKKLTISNKRNLYEKRKK